MCGVALRRKSNDENQKPDCICFDYCPGAYCRRLRQHPGAGTVHSGTHGGGRFGQSLTAIAKLAPDANMGEGLSVHYSGGSGLKDNVTAWLEKNNIEHG